MTNIHIKNSQGKISCLDCSQTCSQLLLRRIIKQRSIICINVLKNNCVIEEKVCAYLKEQDSTYLQNFKLRFGIFSKNISRRHHP